MIKRQVQRSQLCERRTASSRQSGVDRGVVRHGSLHVASSWWQGEVFHLFVFQARLEAGRAHRPDGGAKVHERGKSCPREPWRGPHQCSGSCMLPRLTSAEAEAHGSGARVHSPTCLARRHHTRRRGRCRRAHIARPPARALHTRARARAAPAPLGCTSVILWVAVCPGAPSPSRRHRNRTHDECLSPRE